ncbi:MAG: hypothetical protein EOP36_05655 [Rubrivivax sp.]|nr:MAG: hypothetical protein EOP36_05655 [Rubrivivax sp.]
MTATRLQELGLKRQILLQRSAHLRQTLAQQSAQTLGPVFAVADRFNAARHWVARHPAVVVAGVALLLFRRRPRGLLAWGRKGFWLWGTWRRLQPLLGGRANT